MCETKTRDNVFVRVKVAVQYKIIPEKVNEAYYRLTDHETQIRSYVFDVIRSSIPRLDLDDAFAEKDHIVNEVQGQISSLMAEYGYVIVGVLLTDLDPDMSVKNAMNEINASQRMREAATERAEAEKIMLVKAAEAEADSKELLGRGVARQRKAMVDGLKSTFNEFAESVPGSGTADVMELLLVTQYFDMLRDTKVGKNTLFLPHGPNTIKELKLQLNKKMPSTGAVQAMLKSR
jgi:regulator of protease activity HflC (stomatin/prohibitin superfamily)